MPETKETFDWMALIRALDPDPATGSSYELGYPTGGLLLYYYNALLSLIGTTICTA